MGFYIEELPTELNGITMEEADYLADEFLKDTPCNRMWDAMRALRDFYETVTSEAVVEADRKTEPFDKDINVRSKDEPQTDCVKVGKWYSFTDYIVEMQGDSKPKEFRIVPQTKVRYSDSTDYQGAVDYVTDTDCSWR